MCMVLCLCILLGSVFFIAEDFRQFTPIVCVCAANEAANSNCISGLSNVA